MIEARFTIIPDIGEIDENAQGDNSLVITARAPDMQGARANARTLLAKAAVELELAETTIVIDPQILPDLKAE